MADSQPDGRVYEIAGITLELAPRRPDLDVLLPAPFEAFALPVTSPGAPPEASPGETSLRIRLEESREMEADPPGFFLPYRFELREDATGYAFVNLHEKAKPLGSILKDKDEAVLRLPPAGQDWSDPDVASAVSMGLSDFVKTCLQVRLLERGGTLLHASGVERQGRGYVFLGPSGAGKSTAARLLDGRKDVRVLNDDLVAICLEEEGATVHATPWIGSTGGSCSPGRAALACVFALSREGRGEGFRFSRLDAKAALKELLANLPWLGECEKLTERTVSQASRLARAVPFISLFYSLEDDLWGRVEEALAG